ncbi:hypothetical protein FRC06_005780 [Ceratobasidium sp. 370]|nr:hypothetical protein FRC06_005780 [Ceratobasidium sp. 370]
MEDVRCDVLLLLGPWLESKPAARLVRRLASLVHSQHEVVVHVGWKTPDPAAWGEHVDLHIESEVETWASLYLEQFPKLRRTVEAATVHAITRLALEARKVEQQSSARSSEARKRGDPTLEVEEGKAHLWKRVRFSVQCGADAT